MNRHAIDRDQQFVFAAGLVKRVLEVTLAEDLVEIRDGHQVARPQTDQRAVLTNGPRRLDVEALVRVNGHALFGRLKEGLRAGTRPWLAKRHLRLGSLLKMTVLRTALAADRRINFGGLDGLQ